MERNKFIFTLIILISANLIPQISTNAQSINKDEKKDIYSSFSALVLNCVSDSLGRKVDYHFKYHINKKTGKIDCIIWLRNDSNILSKRSRADNEQFMRRKNDRSLMDLWNCMHNYELENRYNNGWNPGQNLLPERGFRGQIR